MNKEERFLAIILKYREELQKKIRDRESEMEKDNTSHYMIYKLLGFTDEQGYQIDYQQNVGRFLYKYAGSMMEELVIQCFKLSCPNTQSKVKLVNTIDTSPKTFEIDCLVGNKAYEIKWKDATTDGDHIKKERKRVWAIKEAGYTPIRIMFFEPNREQAVSIQSRLRRLYKEVGGEYYAGEEAWEYLAQQTGIDLRKIFEGLKE